MERFTTSAGPRRAGFAEVDPAPELFAVVMATGIVSVAAYDHQYWRLGVALSILAVGAFVVLGLRFLVWMVTRPARVTVLARDSDVALRMFTVVAACAVLGVRWDDHPVLVWLLGGLALAAWLVLAPLAGLGVCSRSGTQLREQAHGAWLLPSVASAGLAITAADLAIHIRASLLVVIAAGAWILAMVLYLAVGWLIGWRVLARPPVPEEVRPDSWIMMGALAITALAGDHILAAVRTLGAPVGLADWTRPVTFLAWVLASLWIPVLLYAEMWRVDQRDVAGRPGSGFVAVSRGVVGGGVPAGDVFGGVRGNGRRAAPALAVNDLAGVLLDRRHRLDTGRCGTAAFRPGAPRQRSYRRTLS
jgi:tellurite resistance protein TehA-like permease